MTRWLRAKIEISVVFLVMLGITASARSASAQQSAQQVVEDLNRGAMEAYNNMDINKAGSMLEEALRVAAQGVPPALLAQTNVNLAIVYIGGLNDNDGGVKYFVDALCADPSTQLDPLTSTPDIQSVFTAAQQKAQQGCPHKGQPNLQVQPAQAAAPVTHFSPPEQLTQTPLPLYVEVSNSVHAKNVYLYYKGTGMEQWKRMPMVRYQRGYAFQVSCSDVFEPQVQYYIEAVGSSGNVVGSAGSASQPITVPVVAARSQPEPALPGAPAPASCAAAECPPGVKGCGETGTGAIGDRCSADKDCQGGLRCDSDVCVLRGAGASDSDDGSGGGGGSDGETPWDNNGGGGEKESNPKDFKRGFLQVGFALGLTYVQPGMLADRTPPPGTVFVDKTTGQYIPLSYDSMGNLVRPNVPDNNYLFAGSQEIKDPTNSAKTLIVSDPKTETAWVPDADSHDSLAQALGGECSADGVATGLQNTYADRLPSRYCVRVKAPGFVPGLALRSALGYFVTPRISLALIMRFQFSAGQGTFSHMLLGARGEYMFTKPKAKGLMVSMYLGGTFGQIQARPHAIGNTDAAPFIKSGLQGGNLGAAFRYRVHKNFGFYMAPELDLQFPTFLWNIDFTFAGLEASF